MESYAIVAQNLCRHFGSVRAVDGLTLEVLHGTVFGFLRPNGAGKTTTIRLLLGLLAPTDGLSRVFGFDTATQADEIRARTGALLEHHGLYERMSAEDNLWVPFLMVTYIVTDTFAGERERYTLKTLLASRLHDKTILFGKIVLVVLYGWGIAIIGIIAGLITVNLSTGKGRLLMYTVEASLAILSLSLLFSLLSSAIGVLISLHSSTVRQAQQITGLISLLPILPIVLMDVLPREIVDNWLNSLSDLNSNNIVVIAVGILTVIDLTFIALAMKRFQRAKLILK